MLFEGDYAHEPTPIDRAARCRAQHDVRVASARSANPSRFKPMEVVLGHHALVATENRTGDRGVDFRRPEIKLLAIAFGYNADHIECRPSPMATSNFGP